MLLISIIVFFFQAEDGIRDKLVTGVQTCALPISENETGFLTRLGQYADWMEITWSEWVIGYDFAHQLALAQNLQRGSRNWSDSARGWFERKQSAGKKWIKSWQLQRGVLGYLLPIALVLFLVALRFNLLAELSRRVSLFFQLRRSKIVRTDPQFASRLYAG